MPGTPGPSSVNELLGSLLSNMATGQSASSPLGSLLSSIGQPTASGSLLSTSPLPPSISTEVAHPPISPLLLGAGRLLLQNWQPILQAGKALASAGGALGGAGTVATVTGAAGAGLVTAGVAKLGLSLLERRLHRRSSTCVGRPDPLRGVSAKSRQVKTKSRKGSSASFAHLATGKQEPSQQLTSDQTLFQLTTLFPHLESSVLAAILASTDNGLNEAVEVVLAQSNDMPTPGISSGPTITTMAPLLSPSSSSSSSPLPPCPECPVCLSSLKGCRIYQCKQGHSLCHQCKNNPQVRCCPTCRGKLTGRATNMEHLLASIYGNS